MQPAGIGVGRRVTVLSVAVVVAVSWWFIIGKPGEAFQYASDGHCERASEHCKIEVGQVSTRSYDSRGGLLPETRLEFAEDNGGTWGQGGALWRNVHVGDSVTVTLWEDHAVHVSEMSFDSWTSDNPVRRVFVASIWSIFIASFGGLAFATGERRRSPPLPRRDASLTGLIVSTGVAASVVYIGMSIGFSAGFWETGIAWCVLLFMTFIGITWKVGSRRKVSSRDR
jgi:hypothetical protein